MNFDDVPKKMLNVDYLTFDVSGKLIYVMLNHRVAYLSWMDAYRKGIIKEQAFLVHIDKHLDFALNQNAVLEEDRKITYEQEKEHTEFVRKRSSLQNCDFIVLAMDRGLIGDGLTVDSDDIELKKPYGTVKSGNYQTTDRIELIDKNGKTHIFYSGGSVLRELCGYQGLLTDTFTHQDVQTSYNNGLKSKNLVFDIDLDYFTYNEGDGQWAMNDRHIDTLLRTDAFIDFLMFSKVITIALEPYYCGDWIECKQILNRLNHCLKEHFGLDIEQKVIETFEKVVTEKS
jgi:hypothetical protein